MEENIAVPSDSYLLLSLNELDLIVNSLAFNRTTYDALSKATGDQKYEGLGETLFDLQTKIEFYLESAEPSTPEHGVGILYGMNLSDL